MRMTEAVRKVQVTMSVAFQATDVARTCLLLLRKEADTPAIRELLNRELFDLMDRVKELRQEFKLGGGDA